MIGIRIRKIKIIKNPVYNMSLPKIEFNEHFKLPIYYNEHKMSLKKAVAMDLELVDTIDGSNNPMYHYFFNMDSKDNDSCPFSKNLIKQMGDYYTTDTDFLKDQQELLQTYKTEAKSDSIQTRMLQIWNEIKNDSGFKEKYYYIDWKPLEFLNRSEFFLQFMSIYNITSPIISLLVPIFILIIPFFIIKIRGLDISMSEYFAVLKHIVSQHAIGKLFTEFNDVSINQKMYILISATFYLFSIYQNIMLCIKFSNNMKVIHNHFINIREYLEETTNSMTHYYEYSKNLETHKEFNSILLIKRQVLLDFKEKISFISKYRFSLKRIFEIGSVLRNFYELFVNTDYHEAFLYSFGFHGYLSCLDGLVQNIRSKQIQYAVFIKNKKNNQIKNNYYAALKNNQPIKNTIRFEKNMIITGPNASGKTTLLKSALLNIIFTQQFGCGFYDSAKLKPYKYIHCYLNIPDTSGRDSLFQAEARRCKEIIETVRKNKDTHFCVFDELYSGTNPEEATASAISFMEYLVKHSNTSSILTTHYIDVCTKLNENPKVANYHMKITNENNHFKYTYRLFEGISKIKGGVQVLKDMDYPEEIINALQKE